MPSYPRILSSRNLLGNVLGIINHSDKCLETLSEEP